MLRKISISAAQEAAVSADNDKRSYLKECDAFSWCVKGMIDAGDGEKGIARLSGYMTHWWKIAFGARPLPEGPVRVNDVYQMIRYELLTQGMRKFGIVLPEVIAKRQEACQLLLEDRARAMRIMPTTTKCLFDYEESSVFGKLFINFNAEEDVVVKKVPEKKVPEEKVPEKKVPAKKVPAKKPVVAKNAPKVAPTKAAVSKPAPKPAEKKISATGRVRELLIAGGKTDEELIVVMKKEFSDLTEKQIKVYIPIQRSNLNRGEFGYKGKKIEAIKS
jgi:hypothetical protein